MRTRTTCERATSKRFSDGERDRDGQAEEVVRHGFVLRRRVLQSWNAESDVETNGAHRRGVAAPHSAREVRAIQTNVDALAGDVAGVAERRGGKRVRKCEPHFGACLP